MFPSPRRIAAALTATAAIVSVPPAPAIDLGLGLFKRRKPAEQQTPTKPDPSQKVKQLVATLQSDPDVDRRKAATLDLRNHDPRANDDIISALVGTLKKDPSPDVRALAAESIGGYRSVSPTAAAALESAEANDPDKTVRAAAKTALWQYGLNGYKPAYTATPTSTPEPPLAKPAPPKPTASAVSRSPGSDVPFRPITQGPAPKTGTATALKQSDEPPLARPKPSSSAATQLPPPVMVPQRMPSTLEGTPVAPPKVTVEAPALPSPRTAETGTVLPPPASSSPLTPSIPLPLPSVPAVPVEPTVIPPIGK